MKFVALKQHYSRAGMHFALASDTDGMITQDTSLRGGDSGLLNSCVRTVSQKS